MQAKNDSLRLKIRVLRSELAKGKLTVAELGKAQEDIKQLRYFVTKYTADIEELKKQNTTLITERDTLKTNLATVSQKATDLEQKNQELDFVKSSKFWKLRERYMKLKRKFAG